MCNILLNQENFRESLFKGECAPPGIMAPFIEINMKEYSAMRENETDELPIQALRERMTHEQYARTLGAISLTLNHAMTFFPAYRFFVSEFLKAEWLALVNWDKFHRDHIVHQSMTVYIGMTLLKKLKFSDGQTLLDKSVDAFLDSENFFYRYLRGRRCRITDRFLCVDVDEEQETKKYFREIWKDIFLDIFFLAALFHDMGYPWKFVNIIHEKLGKHSMLDDPSGQGAEWIAERYKNRLLFAPFHGYNGAMPCDPANWHDNLVELVRKSLVETHGFPGAISFLHLNDVLRKYPNNNHNVMRQFCLEWAAVAIMMHDMVGLHQKGYTQLRIPFHSDPISFVLTLSDTIQEFGRANTVFMQDQAVVQYFADPPIVTDNEAPPIGLTYDQECSDVEFQLNNDVIDIVFCYRKRGDYLMAKHKYNPEVQEQLFDRHSGFLDYSTLGIHQINLSEKFVTDEQIAAE